MNFKQAVKLLEDGHKCKRSDWGYPVPAVIILDKFNDNYHFYITGEYSAQPDMTASYGITYSDIKSNKWIQIE